MKFVWQLGKEHPDYDSRVYQGEILRNSAKKIADSERKDITTYNFSEDR